MNEENSDILSIDEYGVPVYRELEVVEELESSLVQVKGRLVIHKIVIENFKSYSGTKVLGPFYKNFNAIIGPNGSGKSNVIDSILFVFGFRASKIRSRKIGVLIHESDQHRNIQSCTVSVHFHRALDLSDRNESENGENLLNNGKDFSESSRSRSSYSVKDNSDFVVSRTAFRDGSSYYKLNESKVIFKEIENKLKSEGVDLVHNRFLILQGEVEQIALMKPKAVTEHEDGLLEFLEDIVGCNRFKDPIKVMTKRVEDLSELKTEKYHKVKDLELEKNELESEKNKAVKYLVEENNVTRLEKKIVSSKLNTFEEKEKELTVEKKEKNEKVKKLEKRIAEINDACKERTHNHRAFLAEVKKQMQEINKKQEEFNNYEKQDLRCQENLKHLAVKVKQTQDALKKEEQKLEEYKMIPNKQKKDVESMNAKLASLEKEKLVEEEKITELMETFQDDTKELQKNKEKKESQLLEMQKDVNEAKQKYHLAQGELDLFLSTQNKEEAKLNDIKRNIQRLQSSIEEKQKNLEVAQQKVPSIAEELLRKQDELKEKLLLLKKREDFVKERRLRFESARSHFQMSQSRNKVLDFILGLKKSGKISGIHGRLGDLGAIDEKYDIAISTACSGFLDYIVVDNMDVAQKCIEALSQSRVGLASFIGLDKMASWKQYCTSGTKKYPENVARLFDLVKVNNPEFQPAFYFALRETLVASEINQATRIAYGSTRFRVVTLNGQLIDLSGTMSGGGSRVIRGKMGSKIVEDVEAKDLQKMEKEMEKGENDVDKIIEDRDNLKREVEVLQKQNREANHAVQKLSQEIRSLQEQLTSNKGQLKEQEVKLKSCVIDEKKSSRLKANVEGLKETYEKISKVSKKIEDEIHEIHKEIMNIGGTKFKSLETKKQMIEMQIEQLNSTINKINVAVNTSVRKATKSEATITAYKSDLDSTKQKMVELEEEKKKIENEAGMIIDFLNKAESEVKAKEGKLSEISSLLKNFEDERDQVKGEMKEVSRHLEELNKTLRSISQSIEEFKNQLKNLVLNDVDEKEAERVEQISEDQMKRMTEEELMEKVSSIKQELSSMKPNISAIQQFKQKEEIYLRRVDEFTRVSNLKDEQKQKLDFYRKKRLTEFMSGFSQITSKLKEMYQMITMGGDAELELVDSLDPFSEGVVFSVRPPKKSWKNISHLSGGEKTISSLSLVFALHHYKPAPFYVMDEIDAALDFKNVSIVANYIKNRTENAQFIVISLREMMFELSDRLIGISKITNCTFPTMINPYKFHLKLAKIMGLKKTNNFNTPLTAVDNNDIIFNKNNIDNIATNIKIKSNNSISEDDCNNNIKKNESDLISEEDVADQTLVSTPAVRKKSRLVEENDFLTALSPLNP